ncbi:hypothetical protein Q3C01_07860 [Bradyrhizobium sp. UFLA05-109]
MLLRSSILRKVRAALVVVGLVLLWGATAPAQQDLGTLQQGTAGSLKQRKANLEVAKLKLEAKKLADESLFLNRWGPTVIVVVGGILAGVLSGIIAGNAAIRVARRNALNNVLVARKSARNNVRVARKNALAALRVARRNQKADLDQATHERRLESYPDLLTATSPLAIYFPNLAFPTSANAGSLDPQTCETIGRAISKWYFGSGLLLSVESRDAYLRLARALTLASCAEKLYVPLFPRDAKEISAKSVDDYRALLDIEEPDDETIEEWEFGNAPTTPAGKKILELDDYKFKDYVFLQTLSSRLRTLLAEDIRSRRRPAGTSPRAVASRSAEEEAALEEIGTSSSA